MKCSCACLVAVPRRTVSFLATSVSNELLSTKHQRVPGKKQHFPVDDAVLIYTKRTCGMLLRIKRFKIYENINYVCIDTAWSDTDRDMGYNYIIFLYYFLSAPHHFYWVTLQTHTYRTAQWWQLVSPQTITVIHWASPSLELLQFTNIPSACLNSRACFLRYIPPYGSASPKMMLMHHLRNQVQKQDSSAPVVLGQGPASCASAPWCDLCTGCRTTLQGTGSSVLELMWSADIHGTCSLPISSSLQAPVISFTYMFTVSVVLL